MLFSPRAYDLTIMSYQETAFHSIPLDALVLMVFLPQLPQCPLNYEVKEAYINILSPAEHSQSIILST